MARETYAFGYKTQDDAIEAMHEAHAQGEISKAERPEVEFYLAGPKDAVGKRHLPRYRITVLM